ncbi:2-hydroxyacid dehydrogenase [Humitalea sp. 24SJ18S-53]|uniref:2-hydroxyacid dehydrogenase n=1 Tax=Humitalea sp. 24SJ18S-53 TaxID=3422307 RepID=UPI003D664210
MTETQTPRGVLICPMPADKDAMHAAFLAQSGDRRVYLYPELAAPDAPMAEQIGCIVAFRPPRDIFASLPHLRLLHGTGAGVNHMLAVPDLPRHLPMARVVADEVTQGMAQHCLHALLRELRDHRTYDRLQREKVWKRLPQRDAGTWPVGIMGLGALGMGLADVALRLGFAVRGWSRGEKSVPGVATFAGRDSLPDFLAGLSALVVLLPLTPETTGIVGAAELAAMAPGAVVVSAARGGQVIEADLIAALDSGHLSHAHLDVMATEPLPPESPLWTHPAITVTPHIAAAPNGPALARLVLENFARLEAGAPLLFPVDLTLGY